MATSQATSSNRGSYDKADTLRWYHHAVACCLLCRRDDLSEQQSQCRDSPQLFKTFMKLGY
jgi:hypothetical protein